VEKIGCSVPKYTSDGKFEADKWHIPAHHSPSLAQGRVLALSVPQRGRTKVAYIKASVIKIKNIYLLKMHADLH